MHPDLIHNYVSHHFVFAISCHQDYKQALQSKKSILELLKILCYTKSHFYEKFTGSPNFSTIEFHAPINLC